MNIGRMIPAMQTESSHQNGMFSLTRNVTECVKVWMSSSKVGHYT